MTDSEKPKSPPSPLGGNKENDYEGEGWREEMRIEQEKQQKRSLEIIEEQNRMREKAQKQKNVPVKNPTPPSKP